MRHGRTETEQLRSLRNVLASPVSCTTIAAALFVSEGTVKTHVGRVIARLGLRDRAHAVAFAYETGARRSWAKPTAKPTAKPGVS